MVSHSVPVSRTDTLTSRYQTQTHTHTQAQIDRQRDEHTEEHTLSLTYTPLNNIDRSTNAETQMLDIKRSETMSKKIRHLVSDSKNISLRNRGKVFPYKTSKLEVDPLVNVKKKKDVK